MSGPMGCKWFYESPLGDPWPSPSKKQYPIKKWDGSIECCLQVEQLEAEAEHLKTELKRQRQLAGKLFIAVAEREKVSFKGIPDVRPEG